MSNYRIRALVPIAAVSLVAVMWLACTEVEPFAVTPASEGPSFALGQGASIAAARAANARYSQGLLAIGGVVGTAVGLRPDGSAAVRVFLRRPDVAAIPDALDGVPVETQVTGLLMARQDPTQRARPAWIGYSVGHPAITAGSIGGRVTDGSGNTLLLSNNHVLANGNNASLGDPIYQPGPYDGGTAADQIGTLFAFKAISFKRNARNTIDAALALTTTAELNNSTDATGYGAPSADIYGDGDGDGDIDNTASLLGVDVQKFGRTTQLTNGTITGVDATFDICYEVMLIFCTKSARFVDQIVIEPGVFSAGGDSGSLITVLDGTNRPVALLFAGSDAITIANRIDLVLDNFNVAIDAGPTLPPTPVTDVAIMGVGAPTTVTQGDIVSVDVSVRNTGNQDVGDDIVVTLRDDTDVVDIGSQTITGGLPAGATTTLSFSWDTQSASVGTHTLEASHDLGDDNPGNDSATDDTNVLDPSAPSGIHVGDLTAVFVYSDGSTWHATVEIAVHDAFHNPVNGATVTGIWDPAGIPTDQCTTGGLGGDGTCVVSNFSLPKRWKDVTFTVLGVALPGETYNAAQNHDDGGDSDGSEIVVTKSK